MEPSFKNNKLVYYFLQSTRDRSAQVVSAQTGSEGSAGDGSKSVGRGIRSSSVASNGHRGGSNQAEGLGGKSRLNVDVGLSFDLLKIYFV